MTIKNCRVCGKEFFKEPLLRYKNMPAIAQHLPDKESVDKDKGIDLNVYQCTGCGLIQLNSEPVSYYKEVIRASGFSEEMNDFRKKQFNNFVERYSLKGKKIIEIGCGRGEYLFVMDKTGAKAYGIESSDESVKECMNNNLKVSKGFLDKKDYKIKNSPFEAFFMMSFLEHLPEPNNVLRGIGNNIVSEGVGIIEVPNFDMIKEKKLFSEFMRDHLFYFTEDTLKYTLERNGFEVVEIKNVWYDYILSAVVKRSDKDFLDNDEKVKRLDLKEMQKHQNNVREQIYDYVKMFDNGKVAIWGAGHQAFAIMSLMELGDKIKYVVDSAAFKQGKFTPATHIPIVAPDKLKDGEVEAIIIMAGSYSDEIVRIIREKYPNILNIAILRDFGIEKVR